MRVISRSLLTCSLTLSFSRCLNRSRALISFSVFSALLTQRPAGWSGTRVPSLIPEPRCHTLIGIKYHPLLAPESRQKEPSSLYRSPFFLFNFDPFFFYVCLHCHCLKASSLFIFNIFCAFHALEEWCPWEIFLVWGISGRGFVNVLKKL